MKCIRCNEESTSGHMWTRDVLACPKCVRAVASCFPTDEEFFGMLEHAEELARLRRMADAYTRERLFVDVHMYTGDFIYGCKECGRITDEDRKHTATCDVAIHLGLPREKGEGE